MLDRMSQERLNFGVAASGAAERLDDVQHRWQRRLQRRPLASAIQ
jgi:hypothetical protein